MAKVAAKVLATLDRAIERKSRELEKAKRAVERIIELTNDVVSLKRSRQLLAGDTSQSLQQLIAEVNASPKPLTPSQNGHPGRTVRKTTTETPSIGAITVDVLTKAGKPMRIAQILAAVQAAGKPNLNARTLGAILSQYKVKEKIRQTGPGTYAVAEVTGGQEKRPTL